MMSFSIFLEKNALSDETLLNYQAKRLLQQSTGKLKGRSAEVAARGMQRAKDKYMRHQLDKRVSSTKNKIQDISKSKRKTNKENGGIRLPEAAGKLISHPAAALAAAAAVGGAGVLGARKLLGARRDDGEYSHMGR